MQPLLIQLLFLLSLNMKTYAFCLFQFSLFPQLMTHIEVS